MSANCSNDEACDVDALSSKRKKTQHLEITSNRPSYMCTLIGEPNKDTCEAIKSQLESGVRVSACGGILQHE